jgi:PAS domain-containing protein
VSLDPAPAAAAAGDAVVTLDHSAKVASWNRAAEQLLCFSPGEAIRHGLAPIIPDNYRARRLTASRRGKSRGVHPFIKSRGVLRPLRDAAVEFVTA